MWRNVVESCILELSLRASPAFAVSFYPIFSSGDRSDLNAPPRSPPIITIVGAAALIGVA
jgi:hypothetical protein